MTKPSEMCNVCKTYWDSVDSVTPKISTCCPRGDQELLSPQELVNCALETSWTGPVWKNARAWNQKLVS